MSNDRKSSVFYFSSTHLICSSQKIFFISKPEKTSFAKTQTSDKINCSLSIFEGTQKVSKLWKPNEISLLRIVTRRKMDLFSFNRYIFCNSCLQLASIGWVKSTIQPLYDPLSTYTLSSMGCLLTRHHRKKIRSHDLNPGLWVKAGMPSIVLAQWTIETS